MSDLVHRVWGIDEAVIGDALEALRAAVDGVLALDCAAVSALTLAGLITDMETQRRRLDVADTQVIATPAQRLLDLAPRRTLSGEPLDLIHSPAAALAGGEISGAHVDVITRYLGRIPARSRMRCSARRKAFLVDAARHEDPAALRRSGELLLARLDPDGQEPRDKEQDRSRGFGIGGRDPHAVHGSLTDEYTAGWQAILDSPWPHHTQARAASPTNATPPSAATADQATTTTVVLTASGEILDQPDPPPRRR